MPRIHPTRPSFLTPLLTLILALSLVAAVLLAPALVPTVARPSPAHAAPAAQPDAPFQTLRWDGLERTYTVTVPPSVAESGAESGGDADPVPLVIALHDFASSGKALRALSGLDAAAEAGAFIVAYPDSYDLGWTDGRHELGWPTELALTDDVGFILALIDDLSARYPIDPARVRLVAHAGGGSLAQRIACEHPARFDKLVVVGALLWDYVADACPDAPDPAADPASSVSVLTLLGSDNLNYPVRGRINERPPSNDPTADAAPLAIRSLSTYQTSLFWATRNGCDVSDAGDSGDADGADGTDGAPVASVLGTQVFDDCPNDARVELHTLEHVGTNWPRSGDYALNQVGIDATALVADFLAGEPVRVPTPDTGDLWFDTARDYVLYVPPEVDPSAPTPVVVVLHGRPGTAAGMAYLTDGHWVAREHGFMLVYPSGTPVEGAEPGREWNYTRGFPGYQNPETVGEPQVNDTEFLGLMLDDLARDVAIDPARVYVTGFSNGGFMTLRLACEAPDRYAAFAAVGATLIPEFFDLCDPSPAVPILLMHGTLDVSIRWEGYSVQSRPLYLPAPDSATYWAIHNNCDPNATEYEMFPTQDPAPRTFASVYTFSGCTGEYDVLFYVIDGGGHNLPGVPDRLTPAIAGNVNTDIHALEQIWQFFARYTLPDARPQPDGN